MAPLNVLVVGPDKEAQDFEETLEGAKKYVGQIRIFVAFKAVDAVSKLHKLVQQTGACHGAFLSHHFTASGKEEFSDTLRSLLRDKYPTVPVICWGNPKKGGEQGKVYHASVEIEKGSNNMNAVVDVLKQLQAGQIKADYSAPKAGRKSLEGTGSFMRIGSMGRSGTPDQSINRADLTSRAPTMARTASVRRPSVDEQGGTPRARADAGLQRAGSRRSSIDGNGPASPASLGMMNSPSFAGAGVGMGMGMMNSPSFAGAGMGMGMMPSPSFAGAGMGMGMGMMGPPSYNAAQPYSNMPSSMGSFSDPNLSMGMNGVYGASGLYGGGSTGGAGAAGVGGVTQMMGGMSLAPQQPAAAPAQPVGPPSANAELISMLAEEVVRLRAAVEAKRAREVAGGGAPQPSPVGYGMQQQGVANSPSFSVNGLGGVQQVMSAI